MPTKQHHYNFLKAFSKHIAAAVSILLAFSISSAQAATIEIFEGDSFESAVESLNPGDTLIVHSGNYIDSGRISITVNGSIEQPVVIKAADGEPRPHIQRPDGAAAQNTINIEAAQHLTIKGLEISSNGGDGINLNSMPSHINLENLEIHDIDVGINFRSDMQYINVRGNHIYNLGSNGGTGEGMYVGCNNASCIVSHSVIEGNWIHNTLNASQGDGIEIKRGSHSNTIRQNTIHDTQYPCILLYGTEGRARNIVDSNIMWNCGDSGIQAAADAIITNNIILATSNNGFNSQTHQGVTPNNLAFLHNTIIGGSPCLRLNGWENKQAMVFANNAVYCESANFKISGITGVSISGNVMLPAPSLFPSSSYRAGRSLTQDFVNISNRNAYPTKGSPLINSGDSSYLSTISTDFNAYTRDTSPDAGAYEWNIQNNPPNSGNPNTSANNNTSKGGSINIFVLCFLSIFLFTGIKSHKTKA